MSAVHPMTAMKLKTLAGWTREQVYEFLRTCPRQKVTLRDGKRYSYVLMPRGK